MTLGVGLGGAASLGLLVVACGDDATATTSSGNPGAGGESTASMGQGGSGAMGGIDFVGPGGSSAGGNTGSGGSCAGDVTPAALTPLDMYIMLDRSLSMEEETESVGVTKWDAIKSALAGFTADSQSAGIGVGIQYFPANAPCDADADCGGGTCYLKACNNSTPPSPCQNDNECPGQVAGSCVTLGQCGASTCTNVGGSCGGALTCAAVTNSVCVSANICDVSDYSTPDVAIAVLPGVAGAFNASLDAHEPAPIPFGFTPTGPALQGAIDYAQTWATANPEHRTIVVLATDGAPTQCAPTGSSAVAAIAAVGFNTTPSVSTFTIGVFSPNDMTGPTNIEAIAQSGGGESFVVDAMGNVTQQFIDALNAIRTEAIECAFDIPEPEQGQTIDYGKVNVELAGDTLPYVGSIAGCDPTTGGWYYDVNPAQGTPSQIVLCDASCDTLKENLGQDLEIRVGCETVLPPQ